MKIIFLDVIINKIHPEDHCCGYINDQKKAEDSIIRIIILCAFLIPPSFDLRFCLIHNLQLSFARVRNSLSFKIITFVSKT